MGALLCVDFSNLPASPHTGLIITTSTLSTAAKAAVSDFNDQNENKAQSRKVICWERDDVRRKLERFCTFAFFKKVLAELREQRYVTHDQSQPAWF